MRTNIIEILIFILCLIMAYFISILFFKCNLFVILVLGSLMYSLLCVFRLVVLLDELLNKPKR